jgi:hypothetical protein
MNSVGKRNKLVNFYERHGFTTNGKFINSASLQPMIIYLKNKANVEAKMKYEKKRKSNEISAMITPRVTRSRV